MVRHLVRQQIKFGEYRQFLEDARAYIEAAGASGVPRYRVGRTTFGDYNEVWWEAEYESLETLVRILEGTPDSYRVALRALLSHVVDGTQHDYLLEDVDLG